jgi:hypothetical protein
MADSVDRSVRLAKFTTPTDGAPMFAIELGGAQMPLGQARVLYPDAESVAERWGHLRVWMGCIDSTEGPEGREISSPAYLLLTRSKPNLTAIRLSD